MPLVRFTKHAQEKFGYLKGHGMRVSRAQVTHIVRSPDFVDCRRLPLYIAQGNFDKEHVLRVVYRHEGDTAVVITFYPGRKSQYEKE